MRTWTQSALGFVCGSCAAIYAPETPVCLILLPGLKHPKLRCVECAGESAPVDVPLRSQRPAEPAGMASIRSLTGLSFDWKARASKREPGDDDE